MRSHQEQPPRVTLAQTVRGALRTAAFYSGTGCGLRPVQDGCFGRCSPSTLAARDREKGWKKGSNIPQASLERDNDGARFKEPARVVSETERGKILRTNPQPPLEAILEPPRRAAQMGPAEWLRGADRSSVSWRKNYECGAQGGPCLHVFSHREQIRLACPQD